MKKRNNVILTLISMNIIIASAKPLATTTELEYNNSNLTNAEIQVINTNSETNDIIRQLQDTSELLNCTTIINSTTVINDSNADENIFKEKYEERTKRCIDIEKNNRILQAYSHLMQHTDEINKLLEGNSSKAAQIKYLKNKITSKKEIRTKNKFKNNSENCENDETICSEMNNKKENDGSKLHKLSNIINEHVQNGRSGHANDVPETFKFLVEARKELRNIKQNTKTDSNVSKNILELRNEGNNEYNKTFESRFSKKADSNQLGLLLLPAEITNKNEKYGTGYATEIPLNINEHRIIKYDDDKMSSLLVNKIPIESQGFDNTEIKNLETFIKNIDDSGGKHELKSHKIESETIDNLNILNEIQISSIKDKNEDFSKIENKMIPTNENQLYKMNYDETKVGLSLTVTSENPETEFNTNEDETSVLSNTNDNLLNEYYFGKTKISPITTENQNDYLGSAENEKMVLNTNDNRQEFTTYKSEMSRQINGNPQNEFDFYKTESSTNANENQTIFLISRNNNEHQQLYEFGSNKTKILQTENEIKKPVFLTAKDEILSNADETLLLNGFNYDETETPQITNKNRNNDYETENKNVFSNVDENHKILPTANNRNQNQEFTIYVSKLPINANERWKKNVLDFDKIKTPLIRNENRTDYREFETENSKPQLNIDENQRNVFDSDDKIPSTVNKNQEREFLVDGNRIIFSNANENHKQEFTTDESEILLDTDDESQIILPLVKNFETEVKKNYFKAEETQQIEPNSDTIEISTTNENNEEREFISDTSETFPNTNKNLGTEFDSNKTEVFPDAMNENQKEYFDIENTIKISSNTDGNKRYEINSNKMKILPISETENQGQEFMTVENKIFDFYKTTEMPIKNNENPKYAYDVENIKISSNMNESKKHELHSNQIDRRTSPISTENYQIQEFITEGSEIFDTEKTEIPAITKESEKIYFEIEREDKFLNTDENKIPAGLFSDDTNNTARDEFDSTKTETPLNANEYQKDDVKIENQTINSNTTKNSRHNFHSDSDKNEVFLINNWNLRNDFYFDSMEIVTKANENRNTFSTNIDENRRNEFDSDENNREEEFSTDENQNNFLLREIEKIISTDESRRYEINFDRYKRLPITSEIRKEEFITEKSETLTDENLRNDEFNIEEEERPSVPPAASITINEKQKPEFTTNENKIPSITNKNLKYEFDFDATEIPPPIKDVSRKCYLEVKNENNFFYVNENNEILPTTTGNYGYEFTIGRPIDENEIQLRMDENLKDSISYEKTETPLNTNENQNKVHSDAKQLLNTGADRQYDEINAYETKTLDLPITNENQRHQEFTTRKRSPNDYENSRNEFISDKIEVSTNMDSFESRNGRTFPKTNEISQYDSEKINKLPIIANENKEYHLEAENKKLHFNENDENQQYKSDSDKIEIALLPIMNKNRNNELDYENQNYHVESQNNQKNSSLGNVTSHSNREQEFDFNEIKSPSIPSENNRQKFTFHKCETFSNMENTPPDESACAGKTETQSNTNENQTQRSSFSSNKTTSNTVKNSRYKFVDGNNLLPTKSNDKNRNQELRPNHVKQRKSTARLTGQSTKLEDKIEYGFLKLENIPQNLNVDFQNNTCNENSVQINVGRSNHFNAHDCNSTKPPYNEKPRVNDIFSTFKQLRIVLEGGPLLLSNSYTPQAESDLTFDGTTNDVKEFTTSTNFNVLNDASTTRVENKNINYSKLNDTNTSEQNTRNIRNSVYDDSTRSLELESILSFIKNENNFENVVDKIGENSFDNAPENQLDSKINNSSFTLNRTGSNSNDFSRTVITTDGLKETRNFHDLSINSEIDEINKNENNLNVLVVTEANNEGAVVRSTSTTTQLRKKLSIPMNPNDNWKHIRSDDKTIISWPFEESNMKFKSKERIKSTDAIFATNMDSYAKNNNERKYESSNSNRATNKFEVLKMFAPKEDHNLPSVIALNQHQKYLQDSSYLSKSRSILKPKSILEYSIKSNDENILKIIKENNITDILSAEIETEEDTPNSRNVGLIPTLMSENKTFPDMKISAPTEIPIHATEITENKILVENTSLPELIVLNEDSTAIESNNQRLEYFTKKYDDSFLSRQNIIRNESNFDKWQNYTKIDQITESDDFNVTVNSKNTVGPPRRTYDAKSLTQMQKTEIISKPITDRSHSQSYRISESLFPFADTEPSNHETSKLADLLNNYSLKTDKDVPAMFADQLRFSIPHNMLYNKSLSDEDILHLKNQLREMQSRLAEVETQRKQPSNNFFLIHENNLDFLKNIFETNQSPSQLSRPRGAAVGASDISRQSLKSNNRLGHYSDSKSTQKSALSLAERNELISNQLLRQTSTFKDKNKLFYKPEFRSSNQNKPLKYLTDNVNKEQIASQFHFVPPKILNDFLKVYDLYDQSKI